MPSSNNVRKVTSENYPTDAGREGELIFRLVYQQAGCKKPFTRLWLSSMEENAIREGFAHLKPSTEYDALYNAALCRERADWMVGINASRLFSCLYGQPLAVGRVMTPVLAMTVVREAAIAAFVPEKFYTVALTLADGGTASSKRFAQKADAELLLSKCRKEGRVTVQKMERKEKSESPPQLYDLTALQRDANRQLGFTAQQTLDYAQSLYEKRLITYPRTDSCFLTEDMAASLPGLVTATGKAFAVEEPIPIHVQQVINGSKVTDHHALLPTKSMANADLAALPAGERNVLRLISARLLCAVGEPHRYAETTLTTICAGEEFSVKGKAVLSDGWKAMERKMLGELLGKQKEAVVLPDVQEQSQCSIAGAELKEGQTSPPKHFTEDVCAKIVCTFCARTVRWTMQQKWNQNFDGEPMTDIPQKFLNAGCDVYMVMQLRHDEKILDERFASMRELHRRGKTPDPEHYEVTYYADLPAMWQDVPNNEILEELFQVFNLSRPQDFEGHSLSVSDVIALKRNGEVSVHYVDSIGFKDLQGFLDKQPERPSVLMNLKEKCDAPECNPTGSRKARTEHEL